MNAVGMNITTATGLHTVNDLDVSAARLFTNRMKLGEFDPDATVPWLTQARSRATGRLRGVPVGEHDRSDRDAGRLALAREVRATSRSCC